MSQQIINVYQRVLQNSKGIGVSPQMALVLMSLSEQPNQRVGKLAENAGITQQAVGKYIKRSRLFSSKPSKEDRRARSVSLSAAGKRIVKKLEASW